MFHRFSINYIGQMPSVSHFLKLLLLPLLALLLGAGGSKAQITIAEWTFENQNVIADATSIAANQSAALQVVGAGGNPITIAHNQPRCQRILCFNHGLEYWHWKR
jgi:hypothetical protein